MQKKYIGEGLNGRCYELENGEILKVFKIQRDIEELNRYKRFLEYKNDSVYFPYRFITNKKHIKGYISKKAPGKGLDDSLSLFDLEKISTHLIKLENDIALVSNGSIIMCDTHSENILYDGMKFSIIDVDEYFFYECPNNFDNTYPYERNISKIESAIYGVFCNELGKCNFKDKQKILNELKKYIFWNYGPSNQVLQYKMILERVFKENISSLDKVKEIAKK